MDNIETQEIKPGTTTARNTGIGLAPATASRTVTKPWTSAGKPSQLYKKEIATAKTVLWNGPVGIFEIADFARGTFSLAEALAASDARRPSSAAATALRRSSRLVSLTG